MKTAKELLESLLINREYAFKRADIDYEQEVDIVYLIDSITGEDIELWRKDWV